MKQSHRIFKRGTVFYIEDTTTGKQTSLKVTSKKVALQLLEARRLRKGLDDLTWEQVIDQVLLRVTGNTRSRAERAYKSPVFSKLRLMSVEHTTSVDLLNVISDGKYSTLKFTRRLHNLAMDLGWLPGNRPMLHARAWPKVRVKHPNRAITIEEHEKVLASVKVEERRLFYQLLWETGAASHDASRLTAEDIDWNRKVLVFHRAKTGVQCAMKIGKGLEEVLKQLEPSGNLFKTICNSSSVSRGAEFNKRCKRLGISGVTLHSYRYAWAERAFKAGLPERFAQAALGHSSTAMHHAYARRAHVECPSLDEF